MKQLVEFEDETCEAGRSGVLRVFRCTKGSNGTIDSIVRQAKAVGLFSDVQARSNLGYASKKSDEFRKFRKSAVASKPVYKLVDTCAAEFEAATRHIITQPTKRHF